MAGCVTSQLYPPRSIDRQVGAGGGSSARAQQMTRAQGRRLRQIDGRCRWGVGLHPGNPIVTSGGGRVQLARTDHLTIRGSQREVRAAVAGGQLLIARIVWRIGLHGRDACFRILLGGVAFAGQDNLTIPGGLEIEHVLSTAALEMKNSGHLVFFS